MHRLGEWFARLNRRIQPDPMVLACLLTILVALLATFFPQEPDLIEAGFFARAVGVSRIWFDGIWNPGFLKFALQMCVVLLTGYGLARAPIATQFLCYLASFVRSNRAAVVLVGLVACVGCWINWGFGLIAAGVLAAQVRDALHRQGKTCRYALVVAAAYAGMMIWHGGLSGSAPLKVAKDGVQLAATADSAARTIAPIPVTGTVFSGVNLMLAGVLCLGVPLLLGLMAGPGHPDEDTYTDQPAEHEPPDSPPMALTDDPARLAAGDRSLSDRLNGSRAIPFVIAVGLLIALIDRSLAVRDGALVWNPGAINLNFVNGLFLSLGLLLHRNLSEYVHAVGQGGRAVTGIVLQFPLYAGIQGLMFGTGLAVALSQAFVDASSWSAAALGIHATQTFPIATFLSAGVVNFFVPSGGGQWIVQGPLMCTAAASIGASIPQTIMAVAYGDQWTNMIQPFWAIPLMGLTGVNVRRFMGYCALLMLLAGPVFVVALLMM